MFTDPGSPDAVPRRDVGTSADCQDDRTRFRGLITRVALTRRGDRQMDILVIPNGAGVLDVALNRPSELVAGHATAGTRIRFAKRSQRALSGLNCVRLAQGWTRATHSDALERSRGYGKSGVGPI